MPTISLGLDFAWQVAAGEAARGQREFIEPERLFIGVCKFGNLVKDDWSRGKLLENLAEFLKAEAKFVAALYDQFHLDCCGEKRAAGTSSFWMRVGMRSRST